MKTTLKTASRTLLATVAAVGVLAMAAPAMAATQTVGSSVVTGTITDSPVSIDYWQFDVATAGTVTIDVLSRRVLGGDGANGGTTSALDSVVYLFDFDAGGDLGLLGSLVGSDDDSTIAQGGSDGSTSTLDSFLSVGLGTGSFVLALSDFNFSVSEARNGFQTNPGSNFSGTFADYQLTFTGIDTAPAPVPLPAALPLLLGGMSVLGFVGRRRSRAKS